MTLETIITKLKKEFPTLTAQINGEIVNLNINEYETIILQWANNQITATTEAQAKASAKSALLVKLGITEDEAKLLLS